MRPLISHQYSTLLPLTMSLALQICESNSIENITAWASVACVHWHSALQDEIQHNFTKLKHHFASGALVKHNTEEMKICPSRQWKSFTRQRRWKSAHQGSGNIQHFTPTLCQTSGCAKACNQWHPETCGVASKYHKHIQTKWTGICFTRRMHE